MNPILYMAVRTLHFAAMALWVGGPVVAVFGLRHCLLSGRDAALSRVGWLIRVTPIFIASALITLGTGIGLIVGLGGFRNVRGTVLVGALLAICTIPVGGAMNHPALMKLRAHFESGGAVLDAAPLLSRFLRAHWIEQTLRFAALLMMAVRI